MASIFLCGNLYFNHFILCKLTFVDLNSYILIEKLRKQLAFTIQILKTRTWHEYSSILTEIIATIDLKDEKEYEKFVDAKVDSGPYIQITRKRRQFSTSHQINLKSTSRFISFEVTFYYIVKLPTMRTFYYDNSFKSDTPKLHEKPYDPRFETILRSGQYLKNFINLEDQASSWVQFKELRAQQMNSKPSKSLTSNKCDISSVENCIVELSYFYKGLYQTQQKVDYKGVVFQKSCLPDGNRSIVLKIGVIVNNQLRRQVSSNDLFAAIDELILCTTYFTQTKLNQALVDFSAWFKKLGRQISLDGLLRQLEKTLFFKSKSKLLKLCHFSTLFRFLKMSSQDRTKLLTPTLLLQNAKSDNERHESTIYSINNGAQGFFKGIGFEPKETFCSALITKKYVLPLKGLSNSYDKSNTQPEESPLSKLSYEIEFYPQKIRISLVTNLESPVEHIDMFMVNFSKLDTVELRTPLKMDHITIKNVRYLAFKTDLSARSGNIEVLYSILSALDSLLVLTIVFESIPVMPYEQRSNSFIEEVKHYMGMVKEMTDGIYSQD